MQPRAIVSISKIPKQSPNAYFQPSATDPSGMKVTKAVTKNTFNKLFKIKNLRNHLTGEHEDRA